MAIASMIDMTMTQHATRAKVLELSEALDPCHQGSCWPDPIAWDGRSLDVQARDLVALAKATIPSVQSQAALTRIQRALAALEPPKATPAKAAKKGER